MATVRKIFKDGANEMNWLFLSTSGIHGTYCSLDDIESPGYLEDLDDEEGPPKITLLIVMPRLVRTYFGDIEIEPEDIPFLRARVKETLEAVASSQGGNIPKEADE